MTSNNGTFQNGNPGNNVNSRVNGNDMTTELSYEVRTLHKEYFDSQDFWAGAEHDEPVGPQLNLLQYGFPRSMNTCFTNYYLPSSPPEHMTPREESQPEIEPPTSANIEYANHASIFQGHPSSSDRLQSQNSLAAGQVGWDRGNGLPSSQVLNPNNLDTSTLTFPYGPIADHIWQTENARQCAYYQEVTTQQRQTFRSHGDRDSEQQRATRHSGTWAQDSPSPNTYLNHQETGFNLDGFSEYSNGLQQRNRSDQEDDNQFVYPAVPERPERRSREPFPLDTPIQHQETVFPHLQSETRSAVPNHFSQIHMGNGQGNRGYQVSNTHMPQQTFMNENSAPISYQEHPTILGQWRRVQEIYGTSFGILLTSMMIMNVDISDYEAKDRWLTDHGLSDFTRQVFHGQFYVPPQLSGMMHMNVPSPRKRKELKDAIKVAVEPSSWPGTTDFSELRTHFESIRKKALELLEELRDDFTHLWDEHRDRRLN
jgi:hypothetical protein